jgi:hypothetical protein
MEIAEGMELGDSQIFLLFALVRGTRNDKIYDL